MAVLTRNTGGVSKDMTSAAPAQLAKFDVKWMQNQTGLLMGRRNELLGCYFIKTFCIVPSFNLVLCISSVLV